MKLNIVKPEARLIHVILNMVEENLMLGDIEDYMIEQYGVTSDEFDSIWRRLERKINQALNNKNSNDSLTNP